MFYLRNLIVDDTRQKYTHSRNIQRNTRSTVGHTDNSRSNSHW